MTKSQPTLVLTQHDTKFIGLRMSSIGCNIHRSHGSASQINNGFYTENIGN